MRTTWMTSAVALGVAGAALVGCGSETRTAPPVDGTDSAPSVLAVASALNESQLAEVGRQYARWGGDLQTAQAASVVQAHWYNGPQDQCLDEAGVPFEGWPGWQIAISEPAVPQWYDYAELVPPVRLWSADAKAGASAGRLEVHQRTTPPEEYQAMIDECSTAGTVGSEEDLVEFVNPAVVKGLRTEWAAALDEGVTTRPESEVMACLKRAKPRGPFKASGGNQIEAWFSTLQDLEPAPEQVPVGNERSRAPWRAYLDAEESLVSVLWECQGDGDQLLAQVVEVTKQFAAKHAAEIEQAEEAWKRTRERATELGWSPERPLADLPVEQLG